MTEVRWFHTRSNGTLYHVANEHVWQGRPAIGALCNSAFGPPYNHNPVPEAGLPDYAQKCARCAARLRRAETSTPTA